MNGQFALGGRRIAGQIGDRAADSDVSAGRHGPGRLAAGLRHDADLLPLGRIGLPVFESQLGRVEMVVGGRPAQFDFPGSSSVSNNSSTGGVASTMTFRPGSMLFPCGCSRLKPSSVRTANQYSPSAGAT